MSQMNARQGCHFQNTLHIQSHFLPCLDMATRSLGMTYLCSSVSKVALSLGGSLTLRWPLPLWLSVLWTVILSPRPLILNTSGYNVTVSSEGHHSMDHQLLQVPSPISRIATSSLPRFSSFLWAVPMYQSAKGSLFFRPHSSPSACVATKNHIMLVLYKSII